MNIVNEFSNQELQKLDIHELRLIARYVGVASPTSKKKSELIDSIMSIITGKSIPELKNANRGRPAKHKIESDGSEPYVSLFESGEFDVDLQAASPTEDYIANKKYAVVCGVATKKDNDMYLKKFKFADTLDDAYLSEELLGLYDIKENDVVTYVKNGDKLDIYTINEVAAVPNGKYMAANKALKLGKKNLVFVSSVTDKRNILLDLQKIAKVIFVPSNNLIIASGENIKILPPVSFEDDEIINSFLSFCDVCLYYKNSGGNVIMVADNLLSVICSLKQQEYERSIKLEQEIFGKIDKVVASGVTFVALMPNTLKELANNLDSAFDNIV